MLPNAIIDSLKRGIAILLSLCLLWTSGNVGQAAEMAPQVFAAVSNLPQFQLIPPEKLGRIVDYYNGSNAQRAMRNEKAEPLVILIQDLHVHYGVQKNIAGLLEFLSDKLSSHALPIVRCALPPFAVAVEGAQGPIDSSVLALFPDPEIKAQAADYLMREGELTGAENFAVMRGIPDLLVGVENDQYYILNRDLFRKTLADRQELVGLLKGLEADIAPLQEKIYGPALRDFQKKIDAWDKGEMSTVEYISTLVSAYGRLGVSATRPEEITPTRRYADAPTPPSIDLTRDFPTLASFAANARFGTMEQVRAATAQFFTSAAGYLSAEEKKDLTVLAKQTDSTVYYLYVRELIYKHQLFLAAPPELASYLEYLHTEQTMGMDRVTHEARELAFRIKLDLARGNVGAGLVPARNSTNRNPNPFNSIPLRANPLRAGTRPAPTTTTTITTQPSNPAADLLQVQHDLDLLIRIAALQATEFEVKDFGPRLNQFVALCRSLMESNGIRSFDEPKIRALISSSIDYYALALMRNKPMVDNTLALIDSNEQRAMSNEKQLTSSLIAHRSLLSTVILVAGGFHTAPLTELLRQRNISYLVISPTVDSLTQADHDLYIKRLSGNLLTVEDVLASAGKEADSQSRFAKLWPFSITPSPFSGEGRGEGKSLAVGLFGAAVAGVAFAALYATWAHPGGMPADASHITQFLNHYSAQAQNWLQAVATTFAHSKTVTTTVAGVSAAVAGAFMSGAAAAPKPDSEVQRASRKSPVLTGAVIAVGLGVLGTIAGLAFAHGPLILAGVAEAAKGLFTGKVAAGIGAVKVLAKAVLFGTPRGPENELSETARAIFKELERLAESNKSFYLEFDDQSNLVPGDGALSANRERSAFFIEVTPERTLQIQNVMNYDHLPQALTEAVNDYNNAILQSNARRPDAPISEFPIANPRALDAPLEDLIQRLLIGNFSLAEVRHFTEPHGSAAAPGTKLAGVISSWTHAHESLLTTLEPTDINRLIWESFLKARIRANNERPLSSGPRLQVLWISQRDGISNQSIKPIKEGDDVVHFVLGKEGNIALLAINVAKRTAKIVGQTEEVDLQNGRSVTIGPQGYIADLYAPRDSVSRQHATLTMEGDVVTLRDNHSLYGTRPMGPQASDPPIKTLRANALTSRNLGVILSYARLSDEMDDPELLSAIHDAEPQPLPDPLLDRDIEILENAFAGSYRMNANPAAEPN